MSAVDAVTGIIVSSRPSRRRMPVALRGWQGKIGLALLLFVLAIAVLGPLFAPHPIDQPIGIPGAAPSSAAPLGTDFLGRDVLSRVLGGGLGVLTLSVATIVLTYLIGITVGMVAALAEGVVDGFVMRVVDLFLAFPPLLLLLLLVAGSGTGFGVLLIGLIAVLFPAVARLVRTATLEVKHLGFVESASARGEGTFTIMRREILPNIAPSILADFGLRFGAVIILSASMSFLGFGVQPPAANWGLMVAENRPIITTNVAAVLAPAILLAVLTIAVNMLGDGYLRERTRSGNR